MGIEVAIGSLIAIAVKAGTAVAASAAAHPFLFAAGAAAAVAGASTAIVSGVQANKSAKSQASQIELQMQAERTQHAIEAETRQRNLRSMLASQNAIFGGSNVDLSSGSASVIAGATFDEASRQQSQASLFSGVRTSILGMQEADIRSQGRSALVGGSLSAAQSLLSFPVQMASIGSVPGTGVKNLGKSDAGKNVLRASGGFA